MRAAAVAAAAVRTAAQPLDASIHNWGHLPSPRDWVPPGGVAAACRLQPLLRFLGVAVAAAQQQLRRPLPGWPPSRGLRL